MKWITREKAKVDRIACPWLIRRFVDKEAVFEYLPSQTNWNELQQKLGSSGYVYDVPDCLLGHHGEECSFDAIIRHFKLTDPALLLMAKIVRSADTSNKSHAQEGFGLEAIADGFRRISKDDFENQRLQFPVYEALYAYCQAKIEAVNTQR
ncbi:MAG: chromate resistance protein ChrB domain-containing protein [Bdellovibrionota bacterium]